MLEHAKSGLISLILIVLASGAWGQNSQTGIPPFSSQSKSVDLGNLNYGLPVTILSKQGRGIPIDYALHYNSTIYVVATQVESGAFFVTPAPSDPFDLSGESTFGWNTNGLGMPNFPPFDLGFVTANQSSTCSTGATQYTNFVVIDRQGTVHPLPSSVVTSSDGSCGPMQASAFAADQSGYLLTVNSGGGGTAQDAAGNTSGGAGTNAIITDRNGNFISGIPGNLPTTPNILTDTLGVNTLSFSWVLDSSGNHPVSNTYTYLGPGSVNASVVVNYKIYPRVASGFGCPTTGDNFIDHAGLGVNQTPGVALVDNIVLADGSKYSFVYEPTPTGSQFFVSGAVTGRLQSVTLPTGGTISYGYPGSNGGINCNDGTTMGLTVTTSDGTTTYTRSINNSGSAETTTITDPQGNQTVVSFVPATNSQLPPPSGSNSPPGWIETQRQVYQGNASNGTLLRTIVTCYNGNKSNCASTAVSMPITEISRFTVLPNGKQNENEADTFFSANPALVIEVDEYDFGTNQPGALLRKTLSTYASLGNNILNMPAKVTICGPGGKDSDCGGSGTKIAQTTLGYDETAPAASGATQHVSVSGHRGNVTSVHRWLNTTNATLNTVNTFDDAGQVLSTTDPNGNQSSFNYQCDDAFPNQTTLPSTGVSHITSAAYDCATGLLTSSTDQNGNKTSYFHDEMFQPTEVDYPDGGKTTWSYPDPNHVTVQQAIDNSRSTSNTTVLDSYGRTQQTQLSTPDCLGSIKTDTSYDSIGRVASISNLYCQKTDPTYGITSKQYDALNRVTQVTNPDGSTILTSYTGRATQTQDEGNGNGTSRVTRILQTDGLGRLATSCEVTGATQAGTNKPSACNQDIAANGFLTTYTYNVLNNLTGVQQSAVSRSFTYDSLSRLLSETHPESGTTSYTYDSNGNILTRVRPAPNQGKPQTTVTTSYTYDALNRLKQKSYSDGKTPIVNFLYDTASGWGNPTVTQSNLVGRLSEAYLSTSPEGNAVFGYDAMGRITANNQCTPLNCGTGNWPLSYQYDLLGDLTSATNGVGVTFTYTYDAAARLSSMTSSLADNNHPETLYSNLQYNSLGEISATSLGTTLNEISKWDCRGRILGHASAAQPATPTLSLSNTSGCPNTMAMNIRPGPPGHSGQFARAVGFSKPYPLGTSILLTRSRTARKDETGTITVTLLSFDINRSSRNMTASYREGESVLDIAQHLAKEINDANLYRIRVRVRQVGADARLELTSQDRAVQPRITALVFVSSDQAKPSITATVLPIRRPLVLLGRLASPQMEAK